MYISLVREHNNRTYDPYQNLNGYHRQIWEMFPGDDMSRDFQYRIMPDGFYVMSERVPYNSGRYVMDTKPFSPRLHKGMHLNFMLRFNPTTKNENGRHGIITDYCRMARQSDTWAGYEQARNDAVREWFDCHDRLGMRLVEFTVRDCQKLSITRSTGSPIICDVVDIHGTLEVTDSELFLKRLRKGFGKERGFGFGLMLVKRTV